MGHSCYVDAINAAIDVGVTELFMFHLDPNYADPFVERLRTAAKETIAGRKSDLICHLARKVMMIPL